MRSQIVVIGSLNMDLAVCTARIPRLGETVLGSEFLTSPGGKGANQAVAAARLGGRVTMVGSVGDDEFGRRLTASLSQNGVSVDQVSVLPHVATGVATILIEGGDNAIVVAPGANGLVSAQQVRAAESLIRSASIVMTQLEIPLEATAEVVRVAGRQGIPVLLNPAPASYLSDELLAGVSILTPNESEAEILTGLPVNSVADAHRALTYLRGKGVSQVVITLGGQGVVYHRGDEMVHKPARLVTVVDTTAAGDSFSAALAVALGEGRTIDEAVDFGIATGSLTVSRRGAQESLPTRAEVEAL